jgi:hypothetical protein
VSDYLVSFSCMVEECGSAEEAAREVLRDLRNPGYFPILSVRGEGPGAEAVAVDTEELGPEA